MVGPRDRSAWRIKEALDVLEAASSILTEVLLMNIAISPCPNDTFVFHAWVHGLIPGAPKLDVNYADIDITNTLAAGSKGPDVVKISYAALPWVLSEYALLPCGGALGKGCGPLVLTSNKASGNIDPARLSGRRVAVPSERSTAYLLFRLWAARTCARREWARLSFCRSMKLCPQCVMVWSMLGW